MATTVSGPAQPAAAETSALSWLTEWIKGHRQAATYAGVVVVLAAGLFGWNLLSTKTAERNAGSQLEQGRLALDSRNYPLAASVLAQVVENYSGTHAAQEGAILLAQGQQTEARKAFEQSVAISSDFLPATERLLDLDIADKQYAAAIHAGTGAFSINVGESPMFAIATTRARGFRPWAFA